MIPNIKSSEGIGDGVLKKLYMRAQSLSCSACFRNPVRIPVQIISQRSIQLPRFCHWEKQLQKIINGAAGLRSVHYKRNRRVSGSGFNADYYDLNWLSNNDVQIVYVDNDTEIESNLSITVWGLVVKDLSTTSP
jgi:hypothetical protein